MEEDGGGGSLHRYPVATPLRCPKKLELGIRALTTTTMTRGDIHVGMLCVPMTRCGFVLYVRIASTPSKRNTHMLL